MDDARDPAWRFAEVLAELKSRGCTALITGRAPEEAFDEVSTNFLGGGTQRRSRVFGLVDRDVSVARERLAAAGPGYEPTIVVDAMPDAPRAAAATQAELSNRSLAVRRTDYSLSGLEDELVRAVQDVRQLHGPFEPAELRVCLDSLRPLVERCDPDTLLSFLESVTDAVADADGMGHVVLPGDRTDPAIRAFYPAFDVHVELRNTSDCVEQRWRFRDYDVPSPWIRL